MRSADLHPQRPKRVTSPKSPVNWSRVDWKLPVFTMLTIAASSPASSETGGCGGGLETSSSSGSSLATVAALFLPLRFFCCLAVLGLAGAGEGVGATAGAGSGTGAVNGGGVGSFSTTGSSGGVI